MAMRLKDIYDQYKADIFDEVSSNDNLEKETDEWGYHSSINFNGIIAIGWFSNDDILLINTDGIFIYDVPNKEVVFRDSETSMARNISDNNLFFFVESRSENVSIFGLRGGGGNLLTKNNRWSLYPMEIAWNTKIPKLSNNRNGRSYYLELKQNGYEGHMYLGFSQSQKYFLVMGDRGVDIFFQKDILNS